MTKDASGDEKPSVDEKPIVDIPVLTKDAWELLEYRVWDKFKGKMWTLLVIAITLAGLLGTLGVKAYIDNKYESQISAVADTIQKYKTLLIAESNDLLVKEKLLTYLSYNADRQGRLFDELLLSDKTIIDSMFGKNSHIDEVFNDMENRTIDESTYPKIIIFFTDLLGKKNIVSYKKIKDDTLTSRQDDAFYKITEGHFNDLHALVTMYPHLLTQNKAIEHCVNSIFEKDFNSDDQKNRFFKIYEQVIGYYYKNQIQKYNSYWGSGHISKFTWERLPAHGYDAVKMITMPKHFVR